jgi:hypothetical protein
MQIEISAMKTVGVYKFFGFSRIIYRVAGDVLKRIIHINQDRGNAIFWH